MSPLLTSFAGISIYPLGFTRGALRANCFMIKAVSSATQTQGWTISGTSDGSIFIGGSDIYYSPYRTYVAKINKDYSTAWIYGDSNSTGSENVYNLKTNASGGYLFTDWAKNQSSWPAVFVGNADGTQVWTRQLQNSGAGFGFANYGASNEIYFSTTDNGNNNNSSLKRTVVAKYNSSGTIQWQRYIDGGQTYQASIGADASTSTGNIVKAYAPSSSTGGSGWPSITKLNSSGTLQWTSAWPVGYIAYQRGDNLKMDASENVYWLGGDLSANLYIYKLNSSGVEQWKRNYNLTGVNPGAITVDGSGNVYVLGYTSSALYVIKYNSSGTIQWQRSMSISGQSLTTRDASIHAIGGTISFAGYTTRAYYFRMPDDGTLTGAYNFNGETITWAAVSGTDITATTQSFASATHTVAASSATEAANSGSLTSGSLTITNRTIP